MKNEEHTTVTYMLFLAPFPLVLSSKNTAMHYYSMLPVFDHDVNQVKYRHKVIIQTKHVRVQPRRCDIVPTWIIADKYHKNKHFLW